MQESRTNVNDMLSSARQFAEELGKQAEVIHANAKLPAELLLRMRSSGLFRILQPTRFGGLELDFHTFFEVQRVLAQACMSAGWLSGILGLQAWQLALFDPRAQEEVWGENSDTLVSSAFMPSGRVTQTKDGFVLSGNWHYSSGSPHSDWVLLGGLITEEGKVPDYRAFLLPRKDYHISPDWETIGLRATESHSVSVTEAFVPAYRTFRTVDGFKCDCPGHSIHANPLYRVPFGQLFALSIALPALGALEGAIEFTLGSAQSESRPATAALGIVVQHAAIAEAKAIAHECNASAIATLAQLVTMAQDRAVPSLTERARMRFDATRISGKCTHAINSLFMVHGSRSAFLSNKLGRAWLDINIGNLHAGNSVGRFGSQFLDASLNREISDKLL